MVSIFFQFLTSLPQSSFFLMASKKSFPGNFTILKLKSAFLICSSNDLLTSLVRESKLKS